MLELLRIDLVYCSVECNRVFVWKWGLVDFGLCYNKVNFSCVFMVYSYIIGFFIYVLYYLLDIIENY